MQGLRRGAGRGAFRKICEIETLNLEGESGVWNGKRNSEERRRDGRKSRGEIGSPHPLLSPSIIPLPFSWLTLFGHVTAAIAGGERMRKGKGWPDCSFLLLFSPAQNRGLRSDERWSQRKARTPREEWLMGRSLNSAGKTVIVVCVLWL